MPVNRLRVVAGGHFPGPRTCAIFDSAVCGHPRWYCTLQTEQAAG